jgi:hypothetical protein
MMHPKNVSNTLINMETEVGRQKAEVQNTLINMETEVKSEESHSKVIQWSFNGHSMTRSE